MMEIYPARANLEGLGYYSPEVVPEEGPILVVCDSYGGDVVDGVGTWTDGIINGLGARGFDVRVIHPFLKGESGSIFKSIPFPGRKTQPLVTNPGPVRELINEICPQAIFIAVAEGPLGFTAARYADKWGLPYTLMYATDWFACLPDYLHLPAGEGRVVKWVIDTMAPGVNHYLYRNAYKVLVTNDDFEEKLQREFGLSNTVRWRAGVDTDRWQYQKNVSHNPYQEYDWYRDNPLPVIVYFGRLTREKNLEPFVEAKLPGCHRVLIGPGPLQQVFLDRFGKDHPTIHLLGPKLGDDLVDHVRAASALMFLSVRDTFGQVIIEAGAVGVPAIVAQGTGPSTAIVPGVTGLAVNLESEDLSGVLRSSIDAVLRMDKGTCAESTIARFSWEVSVEKLLGQLNPVAPFSFRYRHGVPARLSVDDFTLYRGSETA